MLSVHCTKRCTLELGCMGAEGCTAFKGTWVGGCRGVHCIEGCEWFGAALHRGFALHRGMQGRVRVRRGYCRMYWGAWSTAVQGVTFSM